MHERTLNKKYDVLLKSKTKNGEKLEQNILIWKVFDLKIVEFNWTLLFAV